MEKKKEEKEGDKEVELKIKKEVLFLIDG